FHSIMKPHGVEMKKSNDDPTDDWWFFLLPQRSTKVRQWEYQGAIPRYTVRLPDGYTFTLEMGLLDRDRFFTSPPLVFLDEKLNNMGETIDEPTERATTGQPGGRAQRRANRQII